MIDFVKIWILYLNVKYEASIRDKRTNHIITEKSSGLKQNIFVCCCKILLKVLPSSGSTCTVKTFCIIFSD